jgi:hypothetical protein
MSAPCRRTRAKKLSVRRIRLRRRTRRGHVLVDRFREAQRAGPRALSPHRTGPHRRPPHHTDPGSAALEPGCITSNPLFPSRLRHTHQVSACFFSGHLMTHSASRQQALDVRLRLRDGGNMSLDGLVLVIAFVAIALKSFVWAREADVIEVEDKLHRTDAFRRDGRGRLRLRSRTGSAGPEGLVCTASDSKPKWISDSHV